MPTKKRLINCDFLNASGFRENLSNKAKLLYFFFLTNCDDKGFVDNASSIASQLDQCEENFENTLFRYRYTDALTELTDKRLVFEFVDKVGNKVYLIRHWFFHNNNQKFLSTNYISFLSKVYLDGGKYYLKTHQKVLEKETIKENKIKGNERKGNEIDKELENNRDISKEQETDTWEQEWDKIVSELNTYKENE